MASWLDFGRTRVCSVLPRISTRSWSHRQQTSYTSLAVSCKPKQASVLCCCSPVEADSHTRDASKVEETDSSGLTNQLAPSSSEVEFLLTEICNTSIVEFELKLGGFQLYMLRNLAENTMPDPSPPPPAAPAPTSVEAPSSNGSASSTSLAITKKVPSQGGIKSFLDRASDQGLAILQSPMVGYFRRCRTIKGKKAPPSCKENQIVQEGQVLCFIEQLGGELPVESDISGEVIKVLRKDGEPVGYGDALIAILPSFPGIKKLQ